MHTVQLCYVLLHCSQFEYHVTCGVVTVEGGVVDSVSQRVVQVVPIVVVATNKQTHVCTYTHT